MPAAAKRRHEAASTQAAADDAPSPARKLTQDEVKACADRLSHPIVHGEDPLPPLVPRRCLTKDELHNSVQKLYVQSVARKKQMLEEIAKKRESSETTEPKLIPSIDLDGTFERLYTQQMEARRKMELQQKEKKAQERAKSKRFQNKDEQTESAKRLCDETIQKAREAHRSLFEKYVTGTEPKYKKLTKEEVAASAARLTRKE